MLFRSYSDSWNTASGLYNRPKQYLEMEKPLNTTDRLPIRLETLWRNNHIMLKWFSSGLGALHIQNAWSAFTDSFCSLTYNISVLAGNLGRISMAKQEMVCDLHSEHSQTAGQESAASEEPLTGRMRSVNSAHVITCMLDLRSVAAKYPQNESGSPPGRSLACPQQAVSDQFSQGTQD